MGRELRETRWTRAIGRWSALLPVVLGVAAGSAVWRGATVVAAPPDAGSLSGVVVDTAGDPVAGVCVNVSDGSGAATGSDGRYQVDGVAPGEWTVQFVDCNPSPTFVTVWYQGHDRQDQADVVTVPPNGVVVLGDVVLTAGVAVAGT